MPSPIWRLRWRRPPVDDAYTAYRAYLAALEQEELAAPELERLNPPQVAA